APLAPRAGLALQPPRFVRERRPARAPSSARGPAGGRAGGRGDGGAGGDPTLPGGARPGGDPPAAPAPPVPPAPTPPPLVRVVVGPPQAEATERLRDAGLPPRTIRRVRNGKVP